MKTIGFLALVLGLVAPLVFGAAAPAPGRAPVAPAGKAPGAPAKEAEKKEEEPKIEGITVLRTNGTFLGLEIKSNNFVLKFYGKDKKPMKPDVARASAHWPVRYQPTDERTVLNIADDALTSAFIVRPPHLFKLTLTLLSDVPDKPVETYFIDVHE